MRKDVQKPTAQQETLLRLLVKHGLVAVRTIGNKNKKAAQQKKQQAAYHNTELL